VDSLYTQVDAETRYKTKNFIDTSVWRFGDVAVNGSLNGLRLLGATQPLLAALTVVAAACSARIGWQAARAVGAGALPRDRAVEDRTVENRAVENRAAKDQARE
jgi:AAA family ATP:ADP antiporter